MQKKSFKKLLAVAIVLSILFSVFASCSQTQSQTSSNNSTIDRELERVGETSGAYDNFSSKPLKDSQKLVALESGKSKTKNTVLIYLVGSDLESKGGYATKDIKEMIDCYVDTSKTNVLIYAGGSNSWNIKISASQNTLLLLKNGDFYRVAATKEAANMGYGSTLADFLTYSYKNYPAENYSLIFWNHGGGPIYGYGLDEQFNDRLYLHELEWAMKNSPFKNKKLEFVGFDACLMGTLETAQAFEPYANYFIASEELEPGTGWNYAFLKTYNTATSTRQVTDAVLSYYENSLKNKNSSYTLSCMDLTKLDTLVDAADKLFLEMTKDVLTGGFNAVAKARNNTKRFGVSSSSNLANSYDLVDLYHMAQMLGSGYQPLTQNLKKAINSVVVKNVSFTQNASGVSVYYPYDNLNSFVKGAEDSAKAYFECYGYQVFLTAFASKLINGRKQYTWDDFKPSYYTSITTSSEETSTETVSSEIVTSSAPTSSAPVSSEPTSSVTASAPTSSATSSIPSAYNPTWNTSSANTSSVMSGYNPNWNTSSATSSVMSGYNPNYNTSSSANTSSEIAVWEIQLPQDTADSVIGAYYTVMVYDSATETYTPILSDCKVTVKNGVASIPEDPFVYILKTDRQNAELSTEIVFFPSTEVERIGAKSTFINQSVLLSSGDVTIGTTEPIQIAFDDNGEVTVQSVLSRGEDTDFYGKSDIDLSKYKTIGNLTYSHYLTKDENSNVLPVNKWTTDGSYTISYLPYGENFSIEKKPLSELNGEFLIEVKTRSAQGKETVVEHVTFKKDKEFSEVITSTPEGKYVYNLYSDHAELISFTQKDKFAGEVKIQDKTFQKPVTVIKQNVFKGLRDLEKVTLPKNLETIEQGAFSGCYNLKEITLPQTLEYIGEEAFFLTAIEQIAIPNNVKVISWRAFAGTNLKKVAIPGAVEYIGEGAFYGCKNLTSFSASGNYTSVDGVLFTKNKKTLVAFPSGRGGEYKVPNGTEIIFAQAFRENEKLTKVTFPESLKEIETLAFCDTLNLTEIKIPHSLETIESAAFSKSTTSKVGSQTVNISIPKTVSYIGEEAFSGYRVGSFEVSEENENYSSLNSFLLNKTQTQLISAPSAVFGAVTLPETVNYITTGALKGCDNITELVLPDSVVAISLNAGVPKSLTKLTVGKGMKKFNNIKYFMGVEIVISNDNPNYTVENGVVYSKDLTKLYLFNSKAETYTTPTALETIVSGAFYGTNSTLKTISLTSKVKEMPNGAFGTCVALENINVSADNTTYLSENGLLYSKDGTTLIACPMAKTGEVKIKDGTEEIGVGALYNSFYFKATSLVLPESVKYIYESNLMSLPSNRTLELHLPDSLEFIHPTFLNYVDASQVKITTPIASEGYFFAKKRGFEYIGT